MEKKARIEYLLNEAGRKKSLLAGGDGKELQIVYADTTPEIIDLGKVDEEGNILLQVGFRSYKSDRYPRIVQISMRPQGCYDAPGWRWEANSGVHRFDEPQTIDALVAWEAARVQALANAKIDPFNLAEIARLETEYLERTAREEAERKQREEEACVEREAREAEKAKREAEKAAWVAKHGSDYLKRAVKLGYDCQRQYVTERAALEFPDYTVDFDRQAEWRSRACPSEEALAEVEKLVAAGHKAEVVWLTSPPWELDYDETFDDTEAIVSEYLGKYDLVKII